MSFIFDLDTDGQQAVASQGGGVPIDQLGASGFWQGTPKAIGMGVMRGGARAAQAVGMAAGGLLSIAEDRPGQLTDPYFRALDKYVGEAVNYWTPDANSVGTAGRILGGLAEMTLPLMATGGNPALMIGTTEMGGATDLSKQGASNAGAVAGGVVEGLANAVGFKIPFLGKTLASRIASGMAGNLAVGAGGAAAEKGVLKLTGNQAQADQIHPLDVEGRLVDLLSGAVFGALAHVAAPSLKDAVSAAANAKHYQNDTAPGTPKDMEASTAHQAAIEEGIRAIMEDRPPDLAATGVQDASFLHDRQLPEAPEMPEELKGVDEAIKDARAENPARVELEAEAQPVEQPPELPKSERGQETTVDPIVSAAHEALGKTDIQIPTGDLREDGSAITASGREVMAKLTEDVQAARNEAKGFDALANCILFRGN